MPDMVPRELWRDDFTPRPKLKYGWDMEGSWSLQLGDGSDFGIPGAPLTQLYHAETTSHIMMRHVKMHFLWRAAV